MPNKTVDKIEAIKELIMGQELKEINDQIKTVESKIFKEQERNNSKIENQLTKEIGDINNKLESIMKMLSSTNKKIEKIETEKTDRKTMQELLVGLSKSL